MKAKEIIARNIQRHREMAELKQETLANLLEITPSALSQIETGKTELTITRVEQIAKALNKSFYELITTPNHVGGIQNENLSNNDSSLTKSVSELIKSVSILVEKLSKP
ncbi:MAG: helix-turn-helix domain-containing protein [Chitinophagaceae bacterium]|nr:helix-turn-helix domain-containing protein [Chitinophagaceae bacterium]